MSQQDKSIIISSAVVAAVGVIAIIAVVIFSNVHQETIDLPRPTPPPAAFPPSPVMSPPQPTLEDVTKDFNSSIVGGEDAQPAADDSHVNELL